MAEPLGHDLEWFAGRQRGRGVAVPDAVQGNRRQAGVLDEPGEAPGDAPRVENRAVLGGEDQAGISPGWTPGKALLELLRPMCP